MLLIWGILYEIYQELGYKKMDKYPAFITFGTVFAGVASFSARPWTGVPMIALGSLNSLSDVEYQIPFFSFIFVATVAYLIAFALYILAVKVIIKPEVEQFTNNNNIEILDKLRNNLKLNKEERIAGISFIIFLILLFLPSLSSVFKPLSMSVAITIILAFLCIYRINGKPIIDFQKCASDGISWNIVLMATSMFPLTSALGSDEVGITVWLNNLIGFAFNDMSVIVFLVSMNVICVLITQIAHNAIAASLVIALGYPVSLQLGVDPLLMTILISYSAGLALLTPAASTGAAIGFANGDWIGAKNALLGGIISVVVGIICILAIATPLGMIMF